MESIIFPYRNLRTITLGIVTYHGAARDSLAGTTQVLMQTMVRQTQNYSEDRIAKLIDGTGGSLFSSIEKDFSIIGAQIQPKYALRTLDLLYDIILNPSIEKEHFMIERDNLIQIEQQVRANSLRRMLIFDADKAVFGENHPLGRSQIGTHESLVRMEVDDLYPIHENLLINPLGFAVGDISSDLQKAIKTSFNHFLSSARSEILNNKNHEREVSSKNFISSPNPEDNNAYLCINVATDISPEIIGLAKFSSALLGESFGSRMFSILRDEKGFGYVTGSTIKLLGKTLIVRLFMETTPKRVIEALDELMKIIIDLGTNQVNDVEYSLTRDYILGSLDLSFDDSRSLAARTINRITHGLSSNVESSYKEIEGVQPPKLYSWWNSLINPINFSFVASGNINENEIKEELNIRKISV